jgi:hypothetical protein
MAAPFLRHWYVSPAPVAVTEKIAVLPAHAVVLTGWLEIEGAGVMAPDFGEWLR